MFDPTASSILGLFFVSLITGLREGASSSRFPFHMFSVGLLAPFFYGEHKRTADVGLRACATMQSHGFVSPPSHLFSSLSRTGKPRQFATGPFHFTGYYPGTSFPGHLFHRPRLGPPAVRATSLRRLALSTSLPHLRQVFYSSLLHEHEHKGRGPHGLHDAASCSLAPTDAPYPPSDPLELDPRTALGQHGPVLPFRSCSSCGSFSFQI